MSRNESEQPLYSMLINDDQKPEGAEVAAGPGETYSVAEGGEGVVKKNQLIALLPANWVYAIGSTLFPGQFVGLSNKRK